MTHNPGEDTVEQGPAEEMEMAAAASPEELQPPRASKPVTLSDTELEALNEEVRANKDKYLRALADGENLRKRMMKEKEDYSRYNVANAIADFLHPLDNLEKALGFTDKMSDEVKNWAVGFQMILSQFKDALAANGVTPIETLGKHFDPHLHEAVETVETDQQPPGTILEEFTRGYMMGEKMIRPARVKVSRKPKANAEAAPPQSD